MNAADVAGSIGLGLLIVFFLVVAFRWPAYSSGGWTSERDRQENQARLAKDIDEARARQVKGV